MTDGGGDALVIAILGRSWLAYGIAAAPNAGRVFRNDDDPARASYQSLGIDDQLRVELDGSGDRPVSLSVWIIEPPARPLGTVFVLHGIRSDKSWLKGLALHAAAPDHSELVVVAAQDHFTIAFDHSNTIQTRGMQWLHRWLD